MNSDTKVIIGIGILTVAIVATILIFGSMSDVPNIAAKTIETGKLIEDNSEKSGPTDAKATIVEFGDFQCPACGVFHPILKKLLSDYSGKIQFVFRHFPLSIHANAQLAARAAEAAGTQGKFLEMHDLLYEHQGEWSLQLKPEGVFTKYARDLGLDALKFQKDLKSAELADKIALDMGDGNALNVDATPTIYINGEKLDNPTDQVMRSKIDEALK